MLRRQPPPPSIKDAVNAACSEIRPALQLRYKAWVRRVFDKMVTEYGPHLYGVGNGRWARTYFDIGCIRRGDGVARLADIHEAGLTAAAENYAEGILDAWRVKLVAKLQGAYALTIVGRNDDLSFYARATCKLGIIGISQQVVWKHSPLGKPFCQFPARLYLNGNPISEAQLKAALAQKHVAAPMTVPEGV